MANAPTPGEIFDRAIEAGERRLDQSLLELVSTSFIAGFTIVFGIVEELFEPAAGEIAKVTGALAGLQRHAIEWQRHRPDPVGTT